MINDNTAINNNEMQIKRLQHENEDLKCDYIKQKFKVGQRCRVCLEFADGHNGSAKNHELLARVSDHSDEGVLIRFDKPYRSVPEILIPCNLLFAKYFNSHFFTMQGYTYVHRVKRTRKKSNNKKESDQLQ